MAPTPAPPGCPALPHTVAVEVSANQVDFSSSSSSSSSSASGGGSDLASSFTFSAPLPLEAPTTLLPPMGPVAGGTLVLVSGHSTVGSSRLRCRFGTLEVDGTIAPSDSATTTACITPATPQASGAALMLSLNGQQWIAASSLFTYAEQPAVDSVFPDISPNVGGMVLELTGANLAGGSDYRCGFGDSTNRDRYDPLEERFVPPPTGALPPPDGRSSVEASFDSASSAVLCVSPPGLLGRVRVSVSLNGQQYSSAGNAWMVFYDPDDAETLPYGGTGVADVH